MFNLSCNWAIKGTWDNSAFRVSGIMQKYGKGYNICNDPMTTFFGTQHHLSVGGYEPRDRGYEPRDFI